MHASSDTVFCIALGLTMRIRSDTPERMDKVDSLTDG
jgi:hypothetical protein